MSAIKDKNNSVFLFDKTNYILIVVGVFLLLIGFYLMSGGKSEDVHQFNEEEVFSTTRITLEPILVLLGLVVEIFAIMHKPKQ
jgi:uncharacterized membrane protein